MAKYNCNLHIIWTMADLCGMIDRETSRKVKQMIIPVSVTLGEDNQEILPAQQAGFAYICKHDLSDRQDDARPWHWHDALAFNHVVQGETQFQTPQGTTQLNAGDVIFVNSNVLHMNKYVNGTVEMYFHVFQTELLTGGYNPAMEEKYISSVLYNKDLPVYAIRPDSSQSRAIVQKLEQIEQLAREEPYGYEWQIRAVLCEVWLLFLQQTRDKQQSVKHRDHLDVQRIKVMMDFVHRYYAQPIALEQIAASASISVRECTRCFNRCIHLSPMRYVTDYRVRQAAQKLSDTQMNIMQVAEACGFSSASYFAKVFSQIMGCSPRRYRQK